MQAYLNVRVHGDYTWMQLNTYSPGHTGRWFMQKLWREMRFLERVGRWSMNIFAVGSFGRGVLALAWMFPNM